VHAYRATGFNGAGYKRVMRHDRLTISALGQEQTFHRKRSMSAIPPKADIRQRNFDVCLVPKVSEKSGLFLHLISLFCAN
jgi:hypothetical protein